MLLRLCMIASLVIAALLGPASGLAHCAAQMQADMSQTSAAFSSEAALMPCHDAQAMAAKSAMPDGAGDGDGDGDGDQTPAGDTAQPLCCCHALSGQSLLAAPGAEADPAILVAAWLIAPGQSARTLATGFEPPPPRA